MMIVQRAIVKSGVWLVIGRRSCYRPKGTNLFGTLMSVISPSGNNTQIDLKIM